MPNFLFSDSRRKYEESRRRAAETRRQKREQERDPEIESLKDYLRTLIPKVNSAARRLQNYYAATGHYSPALETLDDSGGLLHMKNTRNELYNEIMRGQMFLEDPTHTVSGAKEFFSKICTVEEMWRIWDRLKSLYPELGVNRRLASMVIAALKSYQRAERYTMDEIMEKMLKDVESIMNTAREDENGMKDFL